MFPVRQKDAPREIHRVHPHTWNYLVIVLWNTIRIFAASARVAFLAGWMYRRPSTGTPEIALIATASFIASSAQEPTLPASTKRLRSSGFQVRSTMQLSHYIALTSQYEANRRIRHDILHHVNTIRYLLANGQQQEATEYAGQLLAENQRSSQLGQCDNPVIDAFLYGRVQEAKAQGITVETVVLLSHKKADSYIHIDVEFGEGEGKIPVDSIAKRAEAYKPKEKVTYKMIKEYIEAKYGFKVHTAYIAEVKRNLGLPMYDAPNAVEELKQPRKHPTPEKVEAIKDALRYFAVI